MHHIEELLTTGKEYQGIINEADKVSLMFPRTTRQDAILAGIMVQQQELIELSRKQNEIISSILQLLNHRHENAEK